MVFGAKAARPCWRRQAGPVKFEAKLELGVDLEIMRWGVSRTLVVYAKKKKLR